QCGTRIHVSTNVITPFHPRSGCAVILQGQNRVPGERVDHVVGADRGARAKEAAAGVVTPLDIVGLGPNYRACAAGGAARLAAEAAPVTGLVDLDHLLGRPPLRVLRQELGVVDTDAL